jgi:lysine 2,3-aminomutase
MVGTMKEDTAYFGVWQGVELVALAAAEQYPDEGFVEMTDFATRVPHRNKGLATVLLAEMEQDMRRRGFTVCYTIAEAVSYGMNITFARRGFHFAGTLVNNTQLHGRITSMNVWYKDMRYIDEKESLR